MKKSPHEGLFASIVEIIRSCYLDSVCELLYFVRKLENRHNMVNAWYHAEEACWAHNPEVGGSKPPSATTTVCGYLYNLFLFFLSLSYSYILG